MKRLFLTALFCIFFFKGMSQEAWKVVSFYTGSIALNAVGESLNHSGNKEWGHFCNAMSIGAMITFPLVTDIDKKSWPVYPVSYSFIRIGIFDPIYNSVQGYPIGHIGTTSLWDKTLQNMNPPDGLLTLGRLMFLTMGVHIPFNYLDREHRAKHEYEKAQREMYDNLEYEFYKTKRQRRREGK